MSKVFRGNGMGGKTYMRQHLKRQHHWEESLPEYLSGLFTSKYGDELYLHFLCPLCKGQVNVLKKLNMKSSEITINYERDVAGSMVNDMRRTLVEHYSTECGYDRNRRDQTAQILIDKFRDEVYR